MLKAATVARNQMLEKAVFDIMGGLPRETTPADATFGCIFSLSFFAYLVAPVVGVIYLAMIVWGRTAGSPPEA